MLKRIIRILFGLPDKYLGIEHYGWRIVRKYKMSSHCYAYFAERENDFGEYECAFEYDKKAWKNDQDWNDKYSVVLRFVREEILKENGR